MAPYLVAGDHGARLPGGRTDHRVAVHKRISPHSMPGRRTKGGEGTGPWGDGHSTAPGPHPDSDGSAPCRGLALVGRSTYHSKGLAHTAWIVIVGSGRSTYAPAHRDETNAHTWHIRARKWRPLVAGGQIQ